MPFQALAVGNYQKHPHPIGWRCPKRNYISHGQSCTQIPGLLPTVLVQCPYPGWLGFPIGKKSCEHSFVLQI